MVVLSTSKTTAFVGSAGEKYVQVELNGGSATLQIKMKGASNFVDFDGGTLEDGVFVYNMPVCDLQLSNITGSPVVSVD